MEIWHFNDPEPLRPFLTVLERQAPELAESAKRLFGGDDEDDRANLLSLARGLVDRQESVRQAVRILLFAPPVQDELGHFRRLLRWLPHWLPPGWHQDPAVRESVTEFASASVEARGGLPLATSVQVDLKGRLPCWKKRASRLSAPCEPAVRRLMLSRLARRLPFVLTPGLRRRLLDTPGLSPGQIYEALDAARRLPAPGVLRHWHRMVLLGSLRRHSTLHPRFPPACDDRDDLSLLSWGRRKRDEILFMERLISYQANELTQVFRLARDVSSRTRRVVLTLHNASLGAATGWGIPSLAQQVCGENAEAFGRQVTSRCQTFAREFARPRESSHSSRAEGSRVVADGLFRLWSKRLVRPPLLQHLWGLRASLVLNDLPFQEQKLIFDHTRELLEEEDGSLQGKSLAVTFAPPNVFRSRLRKLISWYEEKKRTHLSFFVLLWSLLAVGEEWLRDNRIPYLVLPVIDKFFVSSRRDQDLHYLPLFAELAARNSEAPLFLLIDDTSRASHPSLQLAVDAWRRRYPFLGLGVFAGEDRLSASPIEAILAHCSRIHLFALRPLSQTHNPVSLERLLARRPRSFLTEAQYDSSWKDNLPFLYQGTQVAPLAGSPEQTDEFSPVVTTSAGPMAFGTYYRSRLRRLALKRLGYRGQEKLAAKAPLSRLAAIWCEYGAMANL
ncbi:MAG: hypothetical protein ACLFVT_06940, partial [Syntrophobacteria bacterium]